MNFSKLLILACSLASLHSAYAMKSRKPKKSEPKLLKIVLCEEMAKSCDVLMDKIITNYTARLNTLYNDALRQSTMDRNATPSAELLAFGSNLREKTVELSQEHPVEINRFNENQLDFEQLRPIINSFKTSKGFAVLPNRVSGLKLSQMMELHAVLYALTHSLREIDEWIHEPDQCESDD